MGPSFVLLQGLWTGAYVHPAWGMGHRSSQEPYSRHKGHPGQNQHHKALSSHTALSNLAVPGRAASGWHVNHWRKKTKDSLWSASLCVLQRAGVTNLGEDK